MKTVFHNVEKLPKFTWYLSADFKANKAVIYRGNWVEVAQSFIVEGIWSEPFGEGKFHKSECFFGSGIVFEKETIVLVPSLATTDYLYYKFANGMLSASNSLPFLLAKIGDRLDPEFTGYAAINNSIMEGIENYQRIIPTQNGSVNRLLHNNLIVTGSGYNEQPKPMPAAFKSYEEYSVYLKQTIKNCFANARSSERFHPYDIFSTQSKGYDTTAVNSLAAPFGIDLVFTCPDSKEISTFYRSDKKTKTPSDDGKPICDILGLRSQYIDRLFFEQNHDDELLFHAGLHENQDRNLQQMFQHIRHPTVVLTGVLGELWCIKAAIGSNQEKTVNDKLVRGDLSGHGLSEIRLHYGFVHAPIPYIGARHRPSLLQITESSAMLPWKLGRKYDRPIPRRIGEEAGVPREFFGQRKLASIVHFPTPSFPFSPKLRLEFEDFLVQNNLLSRFSIKFTRFIHALNDLIYWEGPRLFGRWPLCYYVNRLVYKKLFGKPLELRRLWRHIDGALFCFACNCVRDQYYHITENGE